MSEAIPTPPPPLPARVYPLSPVAEGDARFKYGLLADVAEMLVEHGYTRPGPLDMVALMQVLYGFLYVGKGR